MAKQVLIADDEPNIVAALEFMLQREGYAVSIARNGSEALQLIVQRKPDLVLLDVMMPLVSGYDVCRQVREREDCRHIKILMLSAEGRETAANKGRSLGADLYVTKPFSTKELMATVKLLLGSAT